MPLAEQTRMRRRIMGVAAAGAVGLTVWMYTAFQQSVRESNERNARLVLKTLASAEADFRGNDRDGNRVQDFWTEDVASLYYLPDPDSGKPIALIEKAVADADAKPARPGAPVPKGGYFFVALVGDSTDSYGPQNSSQFGFCAYPADYPRSGRWTFMINEGNTVFKRDTAGTPILRWPEDDVLKDPNFV